VCTHLKALDFSHTVYNNGQSNGLGKYYAYSCEYVSYAYYFKLLLLFLFYM